MGAISLVDVSISFGGKRVFDAFSASFPLGGITAVVGESGSGKTTLLNMMLGLLEPESGRIVGVPRRISAVFQEDRLIPHLTAAENAALGCRGRADPRIVAEHLEALGLAESMDAPVRTLSGGMKRRVAVARACLAQSDAIIMDEPFASLDEDTVRRVIDYILDTRGGRGLIVSLHGRRYADLLGADIIDIKQIGGDR